MNPEAEIVYDKRYKDRRLIAVRHHLPALKGETGMDWLCGYMEVFPVDKTYQVIKSGCMTWDLDEEYPDAILGITWAGHFPIDGVDPFNYYVGFDTNHYLANEHQFTEREVIQALKKMVKGCQK